MVNMAKRLALSVVLFLTAFLSSWAQMLTPVKWTTSVSVDDGGSGVVTFAAAIDEGWHLYSMDIPDGGPVATSINWEKGWKWKGSQFPTGPLMKR